MDVKIVISRNLVYHFCVVKKRSHLKLHPKSKILKHGYINIYSELGDQESKGLYYKEFFKENNPDWDDTTIILKKWFQSFVENSSDMRVLDLGCGNGNYVIDEFRKDIDWAVGADVTPDNTKKNVCLDEIVYGSAEDLPFSTDEFDVCIALWLVEHLERPEKVFAEVYRVLKPGGIFLFATPNKNSWLIMARRVMGNKISKQIVHKLWGRQSEDIFPTFYYANDKRTLLKELHGASFSKVDLVFNYDPSYTAFNKFCFNLFSGVDFWLSKFNVLFSKHHIAGLVQK